MISLLDKAQVDVFLQRVEEKEGKDAADYCRKWIDSTDSEKVNPEALLMQWQCEDCKDDLTAAVHCASIQTNSRIEICSD